MKKLTALLALFLLLTLLAQGACAALKLSLWSGVKPDLIRQGSSVLTGSLSPDPSIDKYAVSICSIEESKQDTLIDTFNEFYADQSPAPSDSGYTRNALLVNVQLMGRHYTSTTDNDDDYYAISINPTGEGTYSPVIPLSNFIPKGTTFKNLSVFHDRTNGNNPQWELITSDLYRDETKLNTQNNITNRGDLSLRLTVDHFSPFVIVWDELDTGVPAPLTPPDVPQTGDSSSLAPWLLLLGGACALLLLAKKKSAASA